MRIAHLIQTVDVRSGGTSTAFLNTLAALRACGGGGLRWSAFCARPPEGDPAWAEINRADAGEAPGRFHLADGPGALGRGLGPGELGRAVVRAVEAGGIDLLHIHGLWSPDLLAAGLACRRRGVPYVWQPHGMLVREAYAQKRLKKEVFMAVGMRRALQGAAAMLFVTAEERDHSLIPRGIGPERRHVVPLPVRMPQDAAAGSPPYRAESRARFGIAADAPCIVFMGRLHPVKRIEMAIDALALLRARHTGARLLLIGGGDDAYGQSLRQHARRVTGGEDAVVFAGWVQGEDKWRALAAGDVLTLNSLHENFGFVAVEALCVGTMPVLTSNLAIAAEMRAGGVAEVCEPAAPALAEGWSRALTANPGGAVLERGRAWVREHLGLEAVGKRLLDVYQQAMRGPAR
jgi:glycosyltransferase involved in cell wall biosynthesis